MLELNKALYGLKQSARIWLNTLKEILIKLEFKPLESEANIYINNKRNIIISIYVDDLAIISPKTEEISLFIKELKNHFNIKELGFIKDYLGVEIDYNMKEGHLKFNQIKYINKILNKYFKEKNKKILKYIPLNLNIKLKFNINIVNIENIK